MVTKRLWEPVTIGIVIVLLLKLCIKLAALAGTYYVVTKKNVGELGEVRVELIDIKSETERKYVIREVTTKRVETLEYTLNYEPSFQWNNAIDQKYRPQLIKLIQEGIESTAEEQLKRKITLQVALKQTSQIDLDPNQGTTWELEAREEIVSGRVIIGADKVNQIHMPFRLVVAKTLEGRPVKSTLEEGRAKSWWQVWRH